MHFLSKANVLEFIRERLDLFDHAGLSNPFSCSAWMLHFIEQIAEEQWTFVIPEYVGNGESLMLLYSDHKSPYRRSAVANYYTSLYSPLISSVCSASDRNIAVSKLIDQLVELRPRCSIVNLAPLDSDLADVSALRQCFRASGWYVRQYSCFGNWYLPCAGMSFGEYMKSRDSKLFNTWTRKRKKFSGGTRDGARLEIVTSSADTLKAMDAYEKVYTKSWKKPEPYPDFVRKWAVICTQNGWLRLGLAWVGDVPIAAQFWFTMNRHAYIFKLAYDEEYSKWSAGTVLSAHMFEYALEHDRVVEIDYLTGDDAYKKNWMTERRERIGLQACNPRTPRGLQATVIEMASQITKLWRNRLS